MPSPRLQGYASNENNTQGGAVLGGNIKATRDVNITHITTLQPLARSLHRSLFIAPDIFKQIQRELSDLIVILDTTEHNSTEFQSTRPHFIILQTNLQECRDALLELQRMKDHFDSVGSATQVTWERMGWHENELAAIRSRIESHVRALNQLNTAVMISSHTNTKRMLEAFIDEIRNGSRDKSMISCDSLHQDERDSWRMVRKELQSLGITPEIFLQHQVMIISTLKSALGDDSPEDVSHFTAETDIELDDIGLCSSAKTLPVSPRSILMYDYWRTWVQLNARDEELGTMDI
ncbi:uncharacterized protein N7503_008308 [Penicillium pulvis]|uniref:uncharacterized protein n=1 Tax=Penicillium pulvis TaxID=1562058 RepID=UPI00254931AA|nr:uncharacterized protein N7503_008308 [Penicillium pulvis]KAJ5792330.1 hypothetical protein N7503_008308 [Penicillium pulvis]